MDYETKRPREHEEEAHDLTRPGPMGDFAVPPIEPIPDEPIDPDQPLPELSSPATTGLGPCGASHFPVGGPSGQTNSCENAWIGYLNQSSLQSTRMSSRDPQYGSDHALITPDPVYGAPIELAFPLLQQSQAKVLGLAGMSEVELPRFEYPSIIPGGVPRRGGCRLEDLQIRRLTNDELVDLIDGSPIGTVRDAQAAIYDMTDRTRPPGWDGPRKQTGESVLLSPGAISRWKEDNVGHIIRILETVVTPTPNLCIWRQIWADDEKVEAWALGSGKKLTPSEVTASILPRPAGVVQKLAKAGDIDWPKKAPYFYPTDPPNIIDVHLWKISSAASHFWVKRTAAWEIQATYPNDVTFSHPIVLRHQLIWQNWSGGPKPPNAGNSLTPLQQSKVWPQRQGEARLVYDRPVTRGLRPALR